MPHLTHAPLVVLLTFTVFASGVVLLFIGPGSSARSMVFLIHKASFIAWLALTAFHVLGHLPEIVRVLRISPESRRELIPARAPGPASGPSPRLRARGACPVVAGGGCHSAAPWRSGSSSRSC